MPSASRFSIFKTPSELSSHVSAHVSWFPCRGPDVGGVGRPRLPAFGASERAGARAIPAVPPLGLAWLTRCPVFSRQQMKLTAEKLKDESREEGGEKSAG